MQHAVSRTVCYRYSLGKSQSSTKTALMYTTVFLEPGVHELLLEVRVLRQTAFLLKLEARVDLGQLGDSLPLGVQQLREHVTSLCVT